jgi:hypothetical protein
LATVGSERQPPQVVGDEHGIDKSDTDGSGNPDRGASVAGAGINRR